MYDTCLITSAQNINKKVRKRNIQTRIHTYIRHLFLEFPNF